ncbi:hypothetical protein ABPG72_022068 [Tetrahymena utriculariae]
MEQNTFTQSSNASTGFSNSSTNEEVSSTEIGIFQGENCILVEDNEDDFYAYFRKEFIYANNEYQNQYNYINSNKYIDTNRFFKSYTSSKDDENNETNNNQTLDQQKQNINQIQIDNYNQLQSQQSSTHFEERIFNEDITTENCNNNNQYKRKAKDDPIISQIRQIFDLQISIQLLRKLKNEIKKNTIRTVLQKCNKFINQKLLEQYLQGLLFDEQIKKIFTRIDNIYYDLYPKNENQKKPVLTAFVQLFNENRYKFNYKSVRYLLQQTNENQKEFQQEFKIVRKCLKKNTQIPLLINCSKQIFKQFFSFFTENELIPYLYNDYKTNTYPNKNYNDEQYRLVDIQFTIYYFNIFFINNL